jgi:ABC-type multidrug transport system fused ATPase/permease subunit
MINKARKLLSLLTHSERRRLLVLIGVNTLAAFSEVLGVFSVLPFLAVAGDPSLIERQPLLNYIYIQGGFKSVKDFVVATGVLTISAILLTNLIGVGSLWYRTKFCYTVISAMSDRLFRGYLSQPYSFFLSRNTNVLIKDLLGETNGFFLNILDPVTSIIARGLQLLFIICALFLYDWRAALSVGLIFGGFYLGVYLVFHKRLQRIGLTRWNSNELRYSLVGEALGGMKEVQLFGREHWYANLFRVESNRMGSLQGRGFLYAVAPRYLIETLAFGTLVVFVLANLWFGKNLTDILPLLGVFAVAGVRLMPALQICFQYSSALSSTWLTVDKLSKLFTEANALAIEPRLPSVSKETLPLKTTLRLDRIHFKYDADGREILTDVSISIPARACIGFCGASGAGKTTLMDICLGVLEPTAGRVLVDEIQMNASNRRAWQKNVGYVPQKTYLLDATIAENIAFGVVKTEINFHEVERASKMASLHEFIHQLPKGYQTTVGERGIRLSGGQIQRIAIARALYHDPEVLFFDEATSALDTDTEKVIVESIQALAHQKTIVIVAHRLSTLRYCDKIYTVDAGRIRSANTYDELVAST